ncbi:MAG: hypothetical protein JWQ30_1248 [Sediminibacterium sp.]|nr:hypothetical protein [Sediminibacterium sp.]
MRKSILFFAFLILTTYFSHAQNFGGNAASIKWQQINTDTVRVIFPKGYDARAQRIANIIHTLQRNYGHTIGDAVRKVDIVLQNQTLISNGYVALAPFRSEFYTTPPQNAFELGAANWTDNLALHEFRHVQQYNNFNKGLSKAATFLFGEQGQVVANAMSIPDWFFEGDAVFNETKFTQQGRGVLPLFLSSYQSLFLSGRKYDYMKMRNGSLRDYVPTHYDLGYLLVAYGRKKYGDDIWRKVTDDAARFKPLFYPFQGAVKKQTGIAFNQFVNDAMGYYQQQWQSIKTVNADWLTPVVKNDVVNYEYPYWSEDGSLIVVKSSNRHIPAFYKIHPDKSEEKIVVKGIAADHYFSYSNGKIVYASYQPDPRWRNRDYTTIKLLDIKTGEENDVVTHSKYVSPDISHDGRSVLAVNLNPLGGSNVVVMNTEGTITDSLPTTETIFSYPKFAADDKHYYAASRNVMGEMSLLKYTMNDTRAAEVLVRPSNRIIGFLQVQGDTLLFTTTFQGRDELWAIIDGKERRGPFRMASYVTGLYQGSLQSGKIVASAFTADGYRLAAFDPIWERAELKDELTDLYINDVFKKEDHSILSNLPQQQYAVNKYPKASHLLNLHSFRPFYEQPEYSLTVYGNNVLNTLLSEFAYTYNENEGSHKLSYNGIYGGSYLQPLFGVSQTWDRSGIYGRDTIVHWNELVGYAGLQLPLDLSGGKGYRFLTLSSTYNIDNVKWTGIAEKLLKSANFQYLQTRLSYTGQSQKAVQQIYPHFAENLFLQYKNSTSNNTSRQFLATGSLYLPGLGNNHSLVFTAAWHSRDTMNQYLFSNNFPFSRGYSAVDFPRMWKLGVNYHIPLAYPDWGFGNLVYFLRIRSNVFFDYTQGKSLRTGLTYPFRTAGTELFFDTRWWNQQPVTFGIRYSRLLDSEFRGATQPDIFEFILPVNLF